MASKEKFVNRGAWTAEEDEKLTHYVAINGPRRWKSIAFNSGLNRCGKSCRLRWLNYLRPNIKRGNFSDAEDDLILRLHRLLGNRWSLIAQRIPERTDNEIKNYWNSHLSKKSKLMEKLPAIPFSSAALQLESINCGKETEASGDPAELSSADTDDKLFDFSIKGTYGFEWVKNFLELEEDS
ncbi:hypothetical protein ACJIZ3_004145 [Penstemon smallii]|uniref:Uncharacterized protein n=1 Tax=Penstemon smallii TaxID=265156 RepID=A0ABD3S1B1_9LAMI